MTSTSTPPTEAVPAPKPETVRPARAPRRAPADLHPKAVVRRHIARLDEDLFALPWLGDYSVTDRDGSLAFSLYAPGRKEKSPAPVPAELFDLTGVLETLSGEFPSLNFKKMIFTFISSRASLPSSKKRMISP